SGRRMGNPDLRAGGGHLRRSREPGRRHDRRAHRRAARRLWPMAASRILLFRPVRSDGDPPAVPAARNLRQANLNVGSYRVVLGLVALAAALLAPLAVGQFWMTLITQ